MELFQQPFWQNLLAILAGYLIGSIPFAYLFARWRTGKDLRKEGSGNIGTLNSYEVSGSKSVGVLTLVFDVLKGAVPVWFVVMNYSHEFVMPVAVALVAGHCFPVWLRFRGGRGLATAAGVTLGTNWLLLLLWLVGYGVGLIIKRHVNVAAAIATVFTAVVLYFIPLNYLLWFNFPDIPLNEVRNGAWLILLIILIRHIEPLLALTQKRAA